MRNWYLLSNELILVSSCHLCQIMGMIERFHFDDHFWIYRVALLDAVRNVENRCFKGKWTTLYSVISHSNFKDIYDDLEDFEDDIEDDLEPGRLQTWLTCQLRWYSNICVATLSLSNSMSPNTQLLSVISEGPFTPNAWDAPHFGGTPFVSIVLNETNIAGVIAALWQTPGVNGTLDIQDELYHQDGLSRFTLSFVTAGIRRMTERNVFTLSTIVGGGSGRVPSPSDGGTPSGTGHGTSPCWDWMGVNLCHQ